jgi:uncharacterized membrane protein YGL010W
VAGRSNGYHLIVFGHPDNANPMIVVIVLYAIVFLIVPYVLYQVTLGLMGSFVAASLSAILGVVVTIFCIERLDRKVRRIRRGGHW